MVELAVVGPVLIALGFMGAWLTELVRARLVNQALAHAVVWQLAGQLPPGSEWEPERERILAQAQAQLPPVTGLASFQVSLERGESALHFPPPAPGRSAVVSAFLAQGTPQLLRAWGAGLPGQLEARSRLRLQNPLPLPWTGTGQVDGMELATLEAREVLWVDDGHLEDGGDLGPGMRDASRGLFQRVLPLSYLGQPGWARAALEKLAQLPFTPRPLPSFAGTFLASRAYRSAEEARSAPQCDGIPGYLRAVGTESGLQDFMGPAERWLDAVHPQCFDTAPFRDVHAYPEPGGSPGNLSMQLFGGRGPFFMGCPSPQSTACGEAR